MPSQCSTFTAEAFAIKAALEIVAKDNKSTKKNIIIFSDCKAVLQGINNNRLNIYHNKYILNIKEISSKLKKEKKMRILLIWIPSHRGIIGNELADHLAKQGAAEENNNTMEVPIGDMRRIFREDSWQRTQRRITDEASFKGRQFFKNFYDCGKSTWFKKMNEERRFITFINRIRANHYNLNASLARKEYVTNERCDCGYEREDIDHVIWQCRKYEEEREKMGNILTRKKLDGVISMVELESL